MKRLSCLLLTLMLLSVAPLSVFADNDGVITDLTMPRSMTLSETNLTIVRKAPKTQLVATIYPETADQQVKWESSDKKVLTVDSYGKISPKKVGYATVTATSRKNPDLKATCRVQVVDPTVPIEEFTSEKDYYEVIKGKKVKLQYDIKPSNASNKYIKFKVEDDEICYTDSSGYVYGREVGDTVVRAYTDDGGFELEFGVTVIEANTGNYDKFEEDYPNLRILDTRNVDDGIWMDIEGIGTLFYDNFVGEFKEGWHVIDGEQYYFKRETKEVWEDNPSEAEDAEDEIKVSYTFPVMQTGWYQNKDSWSYLKEDGALANNEWVRDSNKWYLIDKDGIMVTAGEKWIGSDRYVFANSGEAIVGFRMVDGAIRHYNQETCSMDINEWFEEPDGRWYYADGEGNIVKNQYIKSSEGNYEYYVDASGVMAFNQTTPDGRWADATGKIGWNGNTPNNDKEEETQEIGPGFPSIGPEPNPE